MKFSLTTLDYNNIFLKEKLLLFHLETFSFWQNLKPLKVIIWFKPWFNILLQLKKSILATRR